MFSTRRAGGISAALILTNCIAINATNTPASADDFEFDPEGASVLQYEAEQIPDFRGFTVPRGGVVNNSGHVAGTYFACPFILSCLSQTYLYDGKSLVHTSAEIIAAVPSPHVGVPTLLDMNHNDQQLIRMAVPDVGIYHYLWDNGESVLISADAKDDPNDGGPLVPMPPPPGTAWALNDFGTVVGNTSSPSPQVFLWNRNRGVVQFIDPPAGFTTISGRGINNHDDVAGSVGDGSSSRGFFWSDGEFTILPPLPGHIESQAVLVNDAGMVVGTSRPETAGNHVQSLVMWQNGAIIDSVTLDHPGGLIQTPMEINEAGHVVGYYWPTAEAFQHFGFIWTPEHGFVDLNGTVANLPQLNIWAAEGINDAGQIGVWAEFPNFTAGAFLFTPIFETPGDLNDDNVVDELDRAIFCSAIGTSTGEPDYIPAADLNHDNVIDHVDLQLFNDILPPCAGDVVSSDTFAPPPDGVTDAADLAYLLGAWGNQPSCADFVTSKSFAPPPDGVIDAADLAFLLGAWGACQ